MPNMPDLDERVVTGGVDTHKEVHVAAAVDGTGRILGTESFAASKAGYRQLLGWMRRFGELSAVGIEGTGTYGAGLARYLASQQVQVVEVIRPNRQTRRLRGKSDPADAEAAARAALSGEASGVPKARNGAVESIRALRVARRGVVKARGQAGNQIRDLVVSGPDCLRERLGPLSTDDRVELAARMRPGDLADPVGGTKTALRSIAHRYQSLTAELVGIDEHLRRLVSVAGAKLEAKEGVGPQVASIVLATVGDNSSRLRSEASFAALFGASPVDASSGKQIRHRLNLGGDREANSALGRVALVRMSHDPRTKAYVERRTKEGKTKKEIIRCLKRYIARELYRALRTETPSTEGASVVLEAA